MRAAILTREFPPDVYGGAGVHVDFLVRELRRLIDVDVHCMGEPREGATAHSEDDPRLAGRQRRAADPLHRPVDDRGRRPGARPRALAHLVRQHGRPLGQAAVRRPARRDRALAGAAAAVEGRAARRRLPALAPGPSGPPTRRADAVVAVSRGMRADVLASYPAIDPARVHVIHNGIDADFYRPDPGTDGARADRRRPDPALRRVRRPDHPAEGRAAPAARRAALRPVGAARAARRRRRHPRAEGRDRRG